MARTPRTPGVVEPKTEPIQVEPDTTVTDDMPNAIDIDARKITAPVLTRQGWVVPAEKPRALPY